MAVFSSKDEWVKNNNITKKVKYKKIYVRACNKIKISTYCFGMELFLKEMNQVVSLKDIQG